MKSAVDLLSLFSYSYTECCTNVWLLKIIVTQRLNLALKKQHDELKAEMEAIQQQMIEAKKNERANALKEVKRLCKEFGFTAGMLKGALAKGRGEKWK